MARAVITWTTTPRTSYVVSYKKSGDSVWIIPTGNPTTSSPFYINNIQTGVLYDFKIDSGCGIITLTGSIPCTNVEGLRISAFNPPNATLTWTRQVGADGYDISYKKTTDTTYIPASGSPINNPTIGTNVNFTIGDLLPNTNYDFKVQTKCSNGSTAGVVVSTDVVPLDPFDYLVITYSWTSDDGTDLDTFTGFINTGTAYDNLWVGYGQANNPVIPTGGTVTNSYLYWAGDNTGVGNESILTSFKNFVDNNPSAPNLVQVRMNAVWWGSRLAGNVTVAITTYLGGTMSQSGFDFVNTGGVQVQQIALSTNVVTQNHDKDINNSDNVAVVTYNKTTKSAQIQLV